MHLLLLPFTNRQVSCVNAVWLQSVEITQNTSRIITILFLLTIVIHKNFCSAVVKLQPSFLPVSKDYTFMIQTDIEVMKNKLEERLREVKEMMLAQEKMVVAAEKKELLKCKAFEIAIQKLSEADIAAITGSFEKMKMN